MARNPCGPTGPGGSGPLLRRRRLLSASVAVVVVVLMFGPPSWGVLGPSAPPPSAAPSFSVSFAEHGLSPGTVWQVTLAGVAKNSTTATIGFTEPNGTYPFTVGAVSGYGTSPPSGSVTVSGSSSSANASFARIAVTRVPVGVRPSAVAADPLTGEVVSANVGSNNVSFVDAATGQLVATVAVGTSPSSVTVDAATGAVLVTDSGSGTLSVIGGATHRVLATVAVGSHPIAAAVDPATGLVYVANELSANVSVVNATTDRVVATLPVGSEPVALAVVGSPDDIYVVNAGSDSVSVINGSSPTVVATVPVGGEPFAIGADDPAGEVFVANVRSDNVSVISIASRRVLASLPVGSQPGYGPSALAVDAVNGRVYVTDFNASAISVIDPSSLRDTATVPVGALPIALAVDPVSGDVYVANEGSANVSVIDGVTSAVEGIAPAALYPLALAILPESSPRVAVADYGGAQLSLFAALAGTPRYAVTFSEQGLPAGTSWSLTLNGSSQSSTSSAISFREPNGTYSYTVGAVPGYRVSSLPSGTVTVNGTSVSQPVGFAPVTYAVTFAETGLPSGLGWSVTVDGVAQSQTTVPGTNTLTFPEANGTYADSIADVPGWHQATLPYSGTVTVNGASVIEPTLVYAPVAYTVKFGETGLPSGLVWSVALNGSAQNSSSATIAFAEPNGSYAFSVAAPGYRPTPAGGNVSVDGGPASLSVTFAPTVVATYAVTFAQSGLPSGTNWSVTLNGAPSRSTGPTIAFTEANGTYSFTIGSVAGYAASPRSGTVAVNGASVSLSVTFAPVTYWVTFTESGLPGGLTWSVTLDGSSQSSTASTISFREPNGTYAFSLGPVSGYTGTPAAGALGVRGAPVSEAVTFSRPAGGGPSSGFLGLAGDTGYLVVGGVVALVAATVAAGFLLRRRGRA